MLVNRTLVRMVARAVSLVTYSLFLAKNIDVFAAMGFSDQIVKTTVIVVFLYFLDDDSSLCTFLFSEFAEKIGVRVGGVWHVLSDMMSHC